MKIKRYHLVAAKDPEQLQIEITKLIAEGWQPFGHVAVTEPAPEGRNRFFQPVVQYEGEIRS